MHLGILTGGGDVPGLNPAIKTVVNAAAKRGWTVTGFRRGWAGPLNYNPGDPEGSERFIMPLTPENVYSIDRTGGTVLMAGYLASADRTLIAEVPFSLDRMTEMLQRDRSANPSNYAVVVVSEGAQIAGQDIFESGDPDAYGHRKLGGIGQAVGEHLKQATGTGVMVQSLAYLLRAGAPDAVDQLVPRNYATMAIRCIEDGRTGLMMAVQDGHYTTAPADISTRGERRVDVDSMYDVENYQPRIAKLDGMPMFLR